MTPPAIAARSLKIIAPELRAHSVPSIEAVVPLLRCRHLCLSFGVVTGAAFLNRF
jgi:hypothetical protein